MLKLADENYPSTRKELVWYLWTRKIMANVFKEGPYYAVTFEGVIYATHLRRINSLSFTEWAQRIVQKFFPF